MKYLKLSSIVLLFAAFMNLSPATAQEFPKMDTSPMDMVIVRDADKAPLMRVIYSRPAKKDRKIFGELVPYGKVWRTGANEATEVEVFKNMKLGDKEIKAGTYTLYTIPGENEWTVVLNKETNAWGAYNYKEELDVVRINVKANRAAAPIESLSMAFKPTDKGTSLMIGWENTFIEVPFEEI